MINRCRVIPITIVLIGLLVIISCLTLNPNREVVQEEAVQDQDTAPGEIVKAKGKVQREKVL